jgi:Fe-S oxidoreductase
MEKSNKVKTRKSRIAVSRFQRGEKLMFDKEKCTLCGECLMKCAYLAYPEEKAKEEFRKLIEGKPTPVTSDCITCCACNMYCPERANPFDLINQRQEETETYRVTDEALNTMSMASQLPSKIVKGNPGRPVLNLCTVGEFLPGVIEGQLFDGLTITKGGAYFCHIGWIHLGKPSKVRENAARFVDNLGSVVKEVGAKEVICFHDDCYALLANKAEEYGIKVPFETVHIIEYMRDYCKTHGNKVKKLNMKIAYQQPCASRYTFGKNEILDDLFRLIGVERVPREYDGMYSLCCGGSQGAKVDTTKEEVEKWRTKNIMDSKRRGAEAMVFLCPLCTLSLRSRAKARGLEPYILSNLVRLALGEELKMGGAGKKYG